MSVIIREEQLTNSLLDELVPLMTAHNKETNTFEKLDISRQDYIAMSNLGILKSFIARDERYEHIVGYIAYIVIKNINNATELLAQQHGFFVDKAHRGRLALTMIRRSEQMLKMSYHVDAVLQMTTLHNDVGALYERLGYTLKEKIYMRRL